MSQEHESIHAAAAALAHARHTGTTCAPVSESFGIVSAADAYAVQEVNTQWALAQGRRLSGRKIGLTSKAVQQQLGVNEPDFGMLFADMEVADGGEVDRSRLIQPKIEAEIAFVLDRDLPDAETTGAEFLRAVAFVLPALEIVDSAIRDWKIALADTIADNASAALYVLGNTPTRLSAMDLRLEGMVLEKNGVLASAGVGAACLGDPLNACLWLVRLMAKADRPLRAGDVLLSGALGPMISVDTGDQVQMRLTRLGDVGCRFV